MALIPTTNVSMRDLQQEYEGSASNVSLDSYYRNLTNAALVDDSGYIPENPIGILQTEPSGNIDYSLKTTMDIFRTSYLYIPGTTIYRTWKYGPSLSGTTTDGSITRGSTNDPYDLNPPAPNGVSYGQVGAYFYFVPDTNYPYPGAPSTASMFIARQQVGSSTVYIRYDVGRIRVASYTVTTWYGMQRSQGTPQSLQPFNQTVPTSGQISLGQFRGQQNP